MSRTDAHAPYWTQAVWYEPSHHLDCEFYTNLLGRRHRGAEVCNLPERAVRHAGVRTRVYVPLCTWVPVWPAPREARWFYQRHVPHWYVNHVWNDVERTRERDQLTKLAKEYNTAGELQDGDFPCWQGRHYARWMWD